MAIRISGKNLDLGEALRTQVEQRVAAALAKYADGTGGGHVVVTRDGAGYRTDCVVHLPSGGIMEATGTAFDAPQSFDQAATRLEKRLRRHNRRAKSRGDSSRMEGRAPEQPMESAYAILEAPPERDEDDETDAQDGDFHPVVIAETTTALGRHSVSDAVLELDITGAPVLVFLHAGHGRVNVVYRRRDGTIGWVDPPSPTR